MMSKSAFPIVLLPVLALACPAARAGFYAFSIGGEVTSSDHSQVSVGDPFAVQYIVDSEDRDPEPDYGSYAATRATATLPNAVILSNGPSQPAAGVSLNAGGTGRDLTWYSDSALNFYHYAIRFEFPAGTLGSDALPLSLPLSAATQAVFGISDGFLIL